MILRPKNLKEMEAQLRAVPADKRKVIVLVGRHPNEGTTNIAVRHHDDWEKEGAVVVRIPGEWTPHFIWDKVLKGKFNQKAQKEMRRRLLFTPNDRKVERFLYDSGFQVPIVSFHGTSAKDIFGVSESHSGEIKYALALKSRLHEHPLFIASKHASGSDAPPNVMTVEYFYDSVYKDPKLLRLRYDRLVKLISPELAIKLHLGQDGQAGLKPRYIEHSTISRSALNFFSKHHAVNFKDVLAHLASTGLKQRKVKPAVPDPYWVLDEVM
ncbi:MAG: hypothetical protein V1722_01955 [Candidatus Micrarchaeota archaeon]